MSGGENRDKIGRDIYGYLEEIERTNDQLSGLQERTYFLAGSMLMTAVVTRSVDLAKSVLTSRGGRIPYSYRECMDQLRESDCITPELHSRMVLLIDLRNRRLAHHFEKMTINEVEWMLGETGTIRTFTDLLLAMNVDLLQKPEKIPFLKMVRDFFLTRPPERGKK